VVTVHALPFHTSASGVDSDEPTAMQKSTEAQATASSMSGVGAGAAALWLQATPFQMSMAPTPVPISPTAMHHVEDTHETEESGGVPEGTESSFQAPDTSSAAYPDPVVPMYVIPTARHWPG
jgi:hypothetical protein